MALVLDASVALKWVLVEPDSHLAEALARSGEDLLVPDFWLGEAVNVLWLQVRRKRLTPREAMEGLMLLRDQVKPTPTAELALHDRALDIALAINHSPYDTLYVAFAIAVGASAVVVADSAFARAMQSHKDPTLAKLVIRLDDWAKIASL